MDAALLDQLKRSPRLKLVHDQLGEILRREQERRERFRNELDETTKAEFINGEVVVSSPAASEHNWTVLRIAMLLNAFVKKHGLGTVQVEKAMVSLTRNDYEPDVSFWGNAKAAAFQRRQMTFPAPDLVVEVLSPTTAATDRTIKFDDYAAHGVAEYWIVDPSLEIVEQYVLEPGGYQLAMKAGAGPLRSRVLVGFDVPVRALFDETENLAAVTQILKP